MKTLLMYAGYTALGFAAAGFLWVYVTTLISYACKAWWTEREAYRRRVDKHVSDMLDREMNEVQN